MNRFQVLLRVNNATNYEKVITTLRDSELDRILLRGEGNNVVRVEGCPRLQPNLKAAGPLLRS